MTERRKHERYQLDDTGIVVTGRDMRKIFAEDISDGGARLKLAQSMDIREGDQLKLFVYDRNAQALLNLDCVIRRIFSEDGHPAVGVQFTEGNSTVGKIIETVNQ